MNKGNCNNCNNDEICNHDKYGFENCGKWTPKWTSVKDALPDKDGKYLVFEQSWCGNFINTCRFTLNLKNFDELDFPNKDRAGWCGYGEDGYYEENDITHWMLLPEPPEEQL